MSKESIPWQLPQQKPYTFTNAGLVDPLKGVVHQGATIKISGGIITAVEHPDISDCRISNISTSATNGNEVSIDLSGKYLSPGLIDCHVHVSAVPGENDLRSMKRLTQPVINYRQARVCEQMIQRGFTSARDCGGASGSLKDAIRDGVVLGPRLFIAGHQLSQTGGHGDNRTSDDTTECCAGDVLGTGRICDGVPDCMRIARDELRQGADFIKIMGGGGISSPTDAIEHVQFTAEEIRAMVTVSKNSGTYVTSHAYTPESIRLAIENGVRGIEHGNLIDESTAKLLAEKNCFLTPTLTTYSAMADPQFSCFLPPAAISKNNDIVSAGIRSIELAADAEVTMCFGTDLLGPMSHLQTREFRLRSQVLPSTKVLQAATVNAARLLQQENTIGQIKPGFAADLLILNQNPLENILVFEDPESNLLGVIKDGRVSASRWTKLPVEVRVPLDMIE